MIFLCIGDSLTAGYPGYYPAFDGFSKGNGNYQSQYEYWLKNYCLDYIRESSKVSVEIFDVYQGHQIPSGKKSVSFSLTFLSQHRTLKEKDVDPVMSSVIEALETSFSASLRSLRQQKPKGGLHGQPSL